MENYTVTILESSKELTAREKIRARNFANAASFDQMLTDDSESFSFAPLAYTVLAVHNESSENKDYTVFLIEDTSNNLYRTGSEAFFSRFKEIFTTMREDAPDEDYTISVFKRPSTKYKGKFVLLCQID